LLREAIQAGRTDEALDLLDYYVIESTQIIGPE